MGPTVYTLEYSQVDIIRMGVIITHGCCGLGTQPTLFRVSGDLFEVLQGILMANLQTVVAIHRAKQVQEGTSEIVAVWWEVALKMVVCMSLNSALDQPEGSGTSYVCMYTSMCRRHTHEHRMGMLSGSRGAMSSVEGSSVSETVPESDSTAPAGLLSRGQGEASLFTCLCQECKGCRAWD